MTAWAHEDATHSPILAAISVEPDSGKSTLLGVLRFLVPKPFVSVEPRRSMLVAVGPSRHVGLRLTSLALHMSQASEYSIKRGRDGM